jgi:hypothetical protein
MYECFFFFKSEKPTDLLVWIVQTKLSGLWKRMVADCSGSPLTFAAHRSSSLSFLP